MSMIIVCPSCRIQLMIANEHLGQNIHCPQCKTLINVPVSSTFPNLGAPPYTSPAASQSWRVYSTAPSKVKAIGAMLIGGGAWAILYSWVIIVFSALWCCLSPGIYLAIVWGILAIIKGVHLLGDRWYEHNPRILVILQIVLVINLDIVNLVMGIVGIIFLSDPEIRHAFADSRENFQRS